MKAIEGRVVIKVDVEQKNFTTFKDGTTIRIERDFNNLDKKYTQQVLGEVVDAEYIPTGALVLFHHNAIHDVNVVFDHGKLSGEAVSSGVKIISITEGECFFWKKKAAETWNPMKNFCTALRVFEPYNGFIEGIEPKLIPNVLYLSSGEYKGKVMQVVKAADYEITFRNESGIDEKIIRCRHFEDEDNDREELIGVRHDLTEKVSRGALLVGISPSDAKILKTYENA